MLNKRQIVAAALVLVASSCLSFIGFMAGKSASDNHYGDLLARVATTNSEHDKLALTILRSIEEDSNIDPASISVVAPYEENGNIMLGVFKENDRANQFTRYTIAKNFAIVERYADDHGHTLINKKFINPPASTKF